MGRVLDVLHCAILSVTRSRGRERGLSHRLFFNLGRATFRGGGRAGFDLIGGTAAFVGGAAGNVGGTAGFVGGAAGNASGTAGAYTIL